VRSRLASLNARLVVTTVGLVVLVSVLVGGATTFAMRAYLTDQLDEDVAAALARASVLPGDRADGPPPRGFDEGPPEIPDVQGQGVGTLTVRVVGDEAIGDVIVDAGRGRTARLSLDEAVLAQVSDLPADGEVRHVDLAGLGSFRVVRSADGTVAAGLPDAEVADAVNALLLREVLLIALGGLLTALVGQLVVGRQLRPLREVAETANAVAQIPLASGSIEIADRVPPHLTEAATEVGQVGLALNTLLAHVETSLEARHQSEQRVRQFVADASHELRTPLTTIAGYTELARRRPDDAEAAATALSKVEEESGRMTALVEDLLLLARLDSGRPLDHALVDLTRLLLEAVSDARVLAPDHQWRLDLPEQAVEVLGDERRLHQVVTNLLTNARKYTPTGTTVTVAAGVTGFSVHDDGPGFPADLVPHAFERFARGDAARHREGGVGLGLALVEAIVSAHGWQVSLRSVPGDTVVEVVTEPGQHR